MAGASVEARACAGDLAQLVAQGWLVTLDWTVPVLNQTIPDHEMTREECHKHADADLGAVLSAEWFWLRAPKGASTGAWVELGAAVSSRGAERIVYSGPRVGIFWSLAGHCFDTHEEALAFLGARA